jgi:hypothetical protein
MPKATYLALAYPPISENHINPVSILTGFRIRMQVQMSAIRFEEP